MKFRSEMINMDENELKKEIKKTPNPGGFMIPGTSLLNKTGSWRTFKPVVGDKCTGCGICAMYCPENAIEIKVVNGKKKAVIDYDYCKGCLICMKECPFKAIDRVIE